MRTMHRKVMAAMLFCCWATGSLAATVFSFPNFTSCTGLQINGNAACTAGVLRLTPALVGQSGSAFSTTQVPLGAGAAFSTFFSFQMTAPGGIDDEDGPGADGIVFVVQPVASTVGTGGGGIGFQGISNSLGVEFDTFNNGTGPGDPDGNHVGVDLNGSTFSVQTVTIPTRLNDGNVWYAWVDYDGVTLEMRLSQSSSRPAAATLSYAVDLPTVLGTTQAFVGFTGGTGTGFENQDILSWQFDNAFAPIGVANHIPLPALSQCALLVLGLLLATAAGLAARKRAS